MRDSAVKARATVRVRRLLAAAVLVTSPVLAADEAPADFATAVTAGDASVSLRYRYEFVDQDSFANDANASTLRLRLNYRTGAWRGWSAFGEFDYVGHILVTDFDSGAGTSPGKAGVYPVVADPKGADLNQLYVDYGATAGWKFRFGRQRIIRDNQRFVGGVGWRQNEQTFDALNLKTTAIPSTTLTYSYVAAVRRVFGDTVPAGRSDTDTHLFNAAVKIDDRWSVVPYFYYIDDDDIASFSTSTLGARLSGKLRAADGSISLVAEIASQSDAANNPVGFTASYLHVDALWSMPNGLSLGLGYESLGGDSTLAGAAFRTPLATLHKFQGWADKFLATPDRGIEDLYASASWTAGKWTLTGIYHDFAAESGGGSYGSEIDVSAGREFAGRYGVLFKGALFRSDAPAAYDDTSKLWVMLTAAF